MKGDQLLRMSKPKKPVEVVVFSNPWKGKNKKSGPGADRLSLEAGPSAERPVFDQKKAKYDIRKLGIHGMDKSNKQHAMADLLVELGAKPQRKRRCHIKEYQQLKKKKLAEEDTSQVVEEGNKKKKTKEKRKRDKDDILNYVDGQAGFYKNGVQFVKKLKS